MAQKTNTKTLLFVGLAFVLVLLLLFLQRNPKVITQAANALAPDVAGSFTVPDTTPYTPRDYPLPPLDSNSPFYLNTGCNFCSKTSVRVITPSPPISIGAQTNLNNYAFFAQPFGGAG